MSQFQPVSLMENLYDYKRYAILYVDDEEKSLKYFTRAFGDIFRILTAPNAEEGYRLLEANADSIGVIMSDQRMPGEKGVQFLEKARHFRPRVIRILATAFTDLDAAIDAVNSGAIYKYITKPWEVPTLETTLKRSLEFFMVQRERDALLREKLTVLQNMVVTDRILSLGVLAAGLGAQMRNTMTAVREFLELAPEILRGEAMDLAQLREPNFWEEFHRNVQSRVRLVVNLLGTPNAPTPSPTLSTEALSLGDLLRDAAAEMAPDLAAASLQLTLEVPADLPPLQANRAMLERLIRLLLRNAHTQLPAGSNLQVWARPVAEVAEVGPALELILSDDGPGVPQEAILSIFNPLHVRSTAANEGGIHLLACFFAVHHQGGRITLSNRPEGGLLTRVVLPLQPAPAPVGDGVEAFLVNAMTNDRLWEKLIASSF